MVHPCDKPCDNKTSSGYCATTACINPQYSNIGTVQYGQGVQNRIVTNADRIRAMTDDELADYMAIVGKITNGCPVLSINCQASCNKCWLDWLKQEVEI